MHVMLVAHTCGAACTSPEEMCLMVFDLHLSSTGVSSPPPLNRFGCAGSMPA